MKLVWVTVDGETILWDEGVLDASPDFFENVALLVDAKVRVRSPRYYFAEDVARMDSPFGALLTVEFLLDLLNVGLVEAPMLFGEADPLLTDNDSLVVSVEKAMSRSEAGKYAAEQRWKNHAKKETTKQETLLSPTDDAEIARATGRPLSWALPATRDPELNEILGRLVADFSSSPPRYHEYDRVVRDPATKELLKYLESKGIVGKSDFEAGKTNAGIMAVGLLLNGLQANSSSAWSTSVPKGFAPYFKARMIAEEGSPVINVNAYALNQIISSGRYKTQFETQESNGALNPYIRAAFESGAMGLHPNMDATKRPVYGTMQSHDSIGNTHPMSQYGTISLQLNESVRERSTVSYNDSLGMSIETAPADSTGKELDRMFNTGSKGGHLDYVETQIHGGVSFSDVKAIWVNEKYAPGDFENVTAILDKYGLSNIPVMRVGVDDFYKAKFSSRSEAGKYAAHIRWMNQRGLTPMTADQWTASQSADATPVVTAPTRVTASGVDWDQPVPQFKTVDEAQAWIDAKWGKRDGGLPDREFKIALTEGKRMSGYFSYGFANIEATQHWIEKIDQVFKEFPEIANAVSFVASAEPPYGYERALGWAGRASASLYFNRGICSDLNLVDATIKEWKKTGYCATNDPTAVLWHEFGHHLGYAAGNANLYGNLTEVRMPRTSQPLADINQRDQKAYEKAIRVLVKPLIIKSINNDRKVKGLKPLHFKGLSEAMSGNSRTKDSDALTWRDEIKKQLSTYSLSNYNEMIAESFAQYAHGVFTGAEISPLARGVVEGLRGYIAGKPLVPSGGSQ